MDEWQQALWLQSLKEEMAALKQQKPRAPPVALAMEKAVGIFEGWFCQVGCRDLKHLLKDFAFKNVGYPLNQVSSLKEESHKIGNWDGFFLKALARTTSLRILS